MHTSGLAGREVIGTHCRRRDSNRQSVSSSFVHQEQHIQRSTSSSHLQSTMSTGDTLGKNKIKQLQQIMLGSLKSSLYTT